MSKISVIGSGFVGQATGKGFAKHGHDITFYDIDKEKVEDLNKQGFSAKTIDSVNSLDSDVIMITVPTPTIENSISLKHIRSAAEWIGKLMRQHNGYQLIVVRSTVPPNSTEGIILPILEQASGKKAGSEFGLAMQPEYLRQVSAEADFARPWFVLIGEYDKKSGDELEKLYRPFNPPRLDRCSLAEAEMQKYVHNLYNAVKISFFNEMRAICKDMDWDAEKILHATAESCEGIWNPIYGLKDKGPFDGACLPKDTAAFYEWALNNGHSTLVLAAAIEQNKHYAKKHGAKELEKELVS